VGHDLVCVASVFPRGNWCAAIGTGYDPRAEKRFAVALPPAFEEVDVGQLLAVLVPRVEKWLVKVKADLVRDIVVTVYAVEQSDGTPLVPSAA